MYTYIHIPFCKSKCSYCDFFSVPIEEKHGYIVPNTYLEALMVEAKYRKNEYSIATWKTLYFGGGTPGLLLSEQVKKLMDSLRAIANIEKNTEVSFEVNPFELSNETSLQYLEELSKAGINRFSCGIQSLHDEALSSVNRRSNAKECLKALECLSQWRDKANSSIGAQARECQFSVDVIAGLPNQTSAQFCAGLEKILSYNPNHVSMYSLIVEESTPLYKAIRNKNLIYDEDESDEQWLLGKDILIKHGYYQYEVSNFSKRPEYESVHNSAYWKMYDYIGLGSGACGTVGCTRYTGSTNIEQYTEFWLQKKSTLKEVEDSGISIIETLSNEDRIFEFLMMGFRTTKGINANDFYTRFSIKLEDRIGEVFEKWEKKGMALRHNDEYKLNERGLLYLNSFLSEII